MEEIDNPDGTKRLEPNPNHPSYAEAMGAYNSEIEKLSRALYIDEGVELTLNEEQQARVDRLRERLGKRGITLDEDDVSVFIAYIAIGQYQDYLDFLEVVSGQSQPTNPK